MHAQGSFVRAAGGGGVVAVVFARLGAEVDFFCALGDDVHGHAAAEQLSGRGVHVYAAWRREPTRRAVTLLEDRGERTIVAIGDRLDPRGSDALPWERLKEAAGVYFTAGDPEALRLARDAKIVVASPRARSALERPGPEIDALVFSGSDRDERDWASRVGRRARLVVRTEGERGGAWRSAGGSSGRWEAVEPPAPIHDAFGCGDSFAAGFTLGLARGGPAAEAAALGAQCGAWSLTQVGPP